MDIIPTQTEGSRGSIYGEDLALERDIFTFIFHPKNLSCRAKKKKNSHQDGHRAVCTNSLPPPLQDEGCYCKEGKKEKRKSLPSFS